MNASILLPDPSILRIIELRQTKEQITLCILVTQSMAKCPDCHKPSSKVHSRYCRNVVDLPAGGFRMVLQITARRFFCSNESCPRKTFTERIPTVVNHYARKTKRLIEAHRKVGFTSGGEVGSRLTLILALPTSPDTLLRLIRSFREPKVVTPAYLGIDDWAFRKNLTYETILVDLETHRPIDLLPDRTTNTLSDWFDDHPGVQIVSRDRSGA
jgi:transposase